MWENKGRTLAKQERMARNFWPDGVVDGVGEEEHRQGGCGEVEMGGEGREGAVRARVVVEHGRLL